MVSGQQHAPAVLYRRERPGTHCTGGWVGPKGRSGRAENIVPTGIRSRTVEPVAQSLYRLSYQAHNCVPVALFIQHAKCMRCVILSPLAYLLYCIYQYYLIKCTI